MKRFYRLFVSLLVIVGIVAVAPATTVDTKAEQCLTSAGSCGGDLVFADADIKKKKKKKGKKMKGKEGKGKKAELGVNGSPSGKRRALSSSHFFTNYIKKALSCAFFIFRK